MKKRVLVTGASGFIGRHTLSDLKNRDYEVYAVTSKSPIPESQDVTWLHYDLLKHDAIKEVVSIVKPTHLLHFAWDVTPGKFWNSRSNFDWIKASLDLLDAFALQGGQRVVIAGSCAEYDWSRSTFCEKTSVYKPHTLYGTSKLALRLLVESFCKQLGISFGWGHIFYSYGPDEYPGRFVASIIKGIIKQEIVPCSHGNQIRDYLHVEDIASAFCAFLDSTVDGAVNIASGQGVTLKQIINTITRHLGSEELIQLGGLQPPMNDPPQIIAETQRLKEELNWTPRYSLEEGLEQVIDWWEKYLALESPTQYRK